MAADGSGSSSEPMKQLVEKYRNEFQETYEGLRVRSQALQESVQQYVQQAQEKLQALEPQLKQERDELVQVLQSVEPVEASQLSGKLLNVYSWVAIMQMGYLITSVLSTYMLYPIIGIALGGFSATVIALVLLPCYTIQQLRQAESNEVQGRFKLLALALAEGALIGFIFADRRLSTFEPLAFLSPLAIAVGSQLANKLGATANQRPAFLGVTVGAGLALQLTLGLVLGQLSASYLLLALLYAGVSYASLQLYIKHQASAEQSPQVNHLFMLGYLMAAVLVEGLALGLFSLDKNAANVEVAKVNAVKAM